MLNPQLNKDKGLTHLLCTEGLSKPLLMQILDRTQTYLEQMRAGLNCTASFDKASLLSLGADAASAWQAALLEAADFLGVTCLALPARLALPEDGDGWQGALKALSEVECDLLVVQHPVSGTPYFLAQHLPAAHHVINAGDGIHAKPLDALLELFLIRERRPDLNALVVVFAGSIQRSGFARSMIHALTTVGVPEVRVIAEVAETPEGIERMGVLVTNDAIAAKADADLVIDLDEDQVWWQQAAHTAPSDKHQVRIAVFAAIFSLILEAK